MSTKFEQLKLLIANYLDVLVIEETELDPSFPTEQFLIEGYSKPYRLDRNQHGEGVITYVREDIPSKELNKHKFEQIFLQAMNKHAPPKKKVLRANDKPYMTKKKVLRANDKPYMTKKKVLRANDKPYMTKIVCKAIMRRSGLENKYYRDKLPETGRAYKKQKNYTKRLIKKEKRKYFSNLNINNYTDNKKNWDTVKPLFSNYGRGDNIISNDEEVAETFNTFFIDSVESLDITEVRFY